MMVVFNMNNNNVVVISIVSNSTPNQFVLNSNDNTAIKDIDELVASLSGKSSYKHVNL